MIGANKENCCSELAEATSYELYVPLEFWFCRNVGLALPLIALQYHEVKINIEYESADNLCDTSPSNYCVEQDKPDGVPNSTTTIFSATKSVLTLDEPTLWVDYIFLDTDERRRFAQLSHEYLIEQLQFTGTDTITTSGNNSDSMKSLRMNFNHPCKELVWTIKKSDESSVYWNNFSTSVRDANAGTGTDNNYVTSTNPVIQAKIMLNGNDRFATRQGEYFSLVQPYQHHENTPDMYHKGINVYSFALKPEEHQPSGTLNMSRIDTAVLSLSSKITGTIFIFAVNYNVLRILSGMGGLAYSN